RRALTLLLLPQFLAALPNSTAAGTADGRFSGSGRLERGASADAGEEPQALQRKRLVQNRGHGTPACPSPTAHQARVSQRTNPCPGTAAVVPCLSEHRHSRRPLQSRAGLLHRRGRTDAFGRLAATIGF